MSGLDAKLVASIRQILERADSYSWSLQGLGMLRLYLSREVRLHVWDSRFVAPGASVIHTHPWQFESFVVSGEVRQFRYTEAASLREGRNGVPYRRQRILCGPEGCAEGLPEEVVLLRGGLETYQAGALYSQEAAEIHESLPIPGTVTVVERTFLDDADHAFVYFQGEEWVSALPRPALPEEVQAIVGLALRRWGLGA